MRIAIEGCAHGELEEIYTTIKEAEKRDGKKVDLLLCCGDFQSTRNLEDLKCMAVPDKFKNMCSFYKYYAAKPGFEAPILTIFIGGNHEASNYLQELPYGGWVAPNIYYLGYAGVVSVNGVRIAGLSGIYKGYDYCKGRFEKPPYDKSTLRSVFHIRNIDVFRLKQLRNGTLDVVMSHDWPNEIHKYGDTEALLRRKPFFREDIDKGELGSKPAQELLHILQPKFWFSAHLHVKFPAIVQHKSENCAGDRQTRFLALDKCLPRRQFLQVLDIGSPIEGPIRLSYDKEWLAILKSTNHLLSANTSLNYMPDDGINSQNRGSFIPSSYDLDSLNEIFEDDFIIPNNFELTSKPYDPQQESERDLNRTALPHSRVNKQNEMFCEKLKIDDPIKIIIEGGKRKHSHCESNKVSLSDIASDSKADYGKEFNSAVDSYNASCNKDEILLDDENEDDISENEIVSTEGKSSINMANDSIPKKAKLQLPEPKRETMVDTISEIHLQSTTSFQSVKDDLQEKLINIDSNATSDINKGETNGSEGNPKKKLKRRNVAIYEDDSN